MTFEEKKDLLVHMAQTMKTYHVTHMKCGDVEMVMAPSYDFPQDNAKMTPDMSDVPPSEDVFNQLR